MAKYDNREDHQISQTRRTAAHDAPWSFLFLKKFNFEDWIFHSAPICGPELCRPDGMMKTRLETNIDGYRLRLVLLFELAYPDATDFKLLKYQ